MIFIHSIAGRISVTFSNRASQYPESDRRVPVPVRTPIAMAPADLAMTMSPQFVRDRTFRLMFLRADGFDVGKAARRIILHFETKKLLFDESRLVKSITWDDLDDTDRDALTSGTLCVLKQKDQAGRRIFFNKPNCAGFKDWIHEVGWLRRTFEEARF